MKQFINLFFASVIMCIPAKGQVPQYVTSISNSFGGSQFEEFFGGSECVDGGYFMTGLTNSTDGDISMPIQLDTANIFVVRCDASGNKMWSGTFGGNDYDKARYGIEDNAGNFLVVGTTHSTDGDITFTHGNSELFVLKLDSLGNKIWMKQYGGTGYESGRYIKQTQDGNYMIAGYTASNNFDVPPGHGAHDGWLMKIDTAGTIIWSNTYGGSGADRIRFFVETPDGGFMFSGSSTSNDFDCTGNYGGTDVWIGKIDSIGNLEWSKLFGGSDEDYAYHVIATPGNNYIITGYTESGDGILSNNYGDVDGWIVKVDIQGDLLNQKHFGGSEADRLYKCYFTTQGDIITAGFTQSNDYDLSGIYNGQSKMYWLMKLDSNLNVNWSYITGGSAADLGKELIYNPFNGSAVIMGDSNSNDGNVLNNHGDFDFWIVKLDLFTDTSDLPDVSGWSYIYQPGNENILITSNSNTELTIRIYNIAGQIVYQSEKVQITKGLNPISVSGFKNSATGVYTFTVSDNSEFRRLKVAHINRN